MGEKEKKKPLALYYDCLNFSEENKAYLGENFDVRVEKVPFYSYAVFRRFLHKPPDVVFWPLGYNFTEFTASEWLPEMRAIASNTTSVDHIDVEYCKDHGIEVIYLDDPVLLGGITAVAELTIGLIICLTRKILPAARSTGCDWRLRPKMYEDIFEPKWSRWEFGGKKMLSRMTVCVVGGLGRIGQHFMGRSWDSSVHRGLFKKVVAIDLDTEWHDLGKFDIVTVHIPRKNNENFCDKAFFDKMKDGSYFINTSRGEIVDEKALVDALSSGKLAGAAVDVLRGEFDLGFDVKDNTLVKYAKEHDNLIITPHIGGSTEDAWHMTQRHVIDKVIDVFRDNSSKKG